jgi:hypothetical protein
MKVIDGILLVVLTISITYTITPRSEVYGKNGAKSANAFTQKCVEIIVKYK